MTRKGKLSEIFSKALYSDNPNLYLVGYTDFNEVKESTLPEFISLRKFWDIPATRIVYIKRENRVLWAKKENRTT